MIKWLIQFGHFVFCAFSSNSFCSSFNWNRIIEFDLDQFGQFDKSITVVEKLRLPVGHFLPLLCGLFFEFGAQV